MAKFTVAIAYGKGVTMCEEFKGTLNGSSFAEFVRTHFPPCFQNSANADGKLFLQDGDHSQNSALAMDALGEIGGRKFAIPPRSPHLNPIENVFHLAKRRLKTEAVGKNITKETYDEFLLRIERTLKSTPSNQ